MQLSTITLLSASFFAFSSLAQSTLTPAQALQATCLLACPADNPTCRTKCIVSDTSDWNAQTRVLDCIGACPKGNGTAPENLAFENCQKACVKFAAAELPIVYSGSAGIPTVLVITTSSSVIASGTVSVTATGTGRVAAVTGSASTGTLTSAVLSTSKSSKSAKTTATDEEASSPSASASASATGNSAGNLKVGGGAGVLFGMGVVLLL